MKGNRQNSTKIRYDHLMHSGKNTSRTSRLVGWPFSKVVSLIISPFCSPGGKGKCSHEAAEAAARGVGGGVSACYSRPQEAAAGAG